MGVFRNFVLTIMEVFLNQGLMLGFTFGAMILLRPVTNRILRPKYRVSLWIVGWVMSWSKSFYQFPGLIAVLPYTLRGWITPERSLDERFPGYVPELTQAGAYTVELPGDISIPFTVTEGMLNVLAVVSVLGIVLLLWWSGRGEHELKRLSRQGDPMDEEWMKRYGVELADVEVRILDGLPASFVCSMGEGRHNICLQKELPEAQMKLVLRHELAHIRRSHVWLKGFAAAIRCMYWWNPVVWVAYRLTCRDIELACDEEVLDALDETERRDYARALVELGSGKHLWGSMTCFGECDAVIRVRRVVDWKREKRWAGLVVWPVLVLLLLFFFTSPTTKRDEKELQEYLCHAAFTLDLRNWVWDPELNLQEIWVNREKNDRPQVMALDRQGNWYGCYLLKEEDHEGDPFVLKEVLEFGPDFGPPDPEHYEKIAEYTGKYK